MAVDLRSGTCETFLENKWGVVIRWCAEMRKCETVTGISMGVTTWPWTKQAESVKHSSETGLRLKFDGAQRGRKCETFAKNRLGP